MAEAQPKAVYCTNLELPAGVHDFEASDTKTKAPDTDPIKRVIYMDDKVVPGSFYVEAVWVMGSIPRTHPEHSHPDHDEICGFVGSNMDDPSDLGAEIDFVVDGVKTTITKTTSNRGLTIGCHGGENQGTDIENEKRTAITFAEM